MLQNEFFRVQSYNPDLPEETWELVFEKNTSGAYSQSLGWGKYKIVFSGGGGSGGASSATHWNYQDWANNGSAGEESYIITTIGYDATRVYSGIIGEGGKSSYAYSRYDETPTVTAGNAGVGYENGTKGGTKSGMGESVADRSGAAGGAGGGSTSLTLGSSGGTIFAKGGNGGAASADRIDSVSGGIGGSGGTTSGTGAAGGNGAFGYRGPATSGAGADGYVRIYKSNIKPNAN
jgi:hypothetical protein